MTPDDLPDIPGVDPETSLAMRTAAAAWHNLCDAAQGCVDMAADVDPDRLDITDDYPAALEQLQAAMVDRALHEVQDASVRFQAAIDIKPDLGEQLRKGPMMEGEIALIGAVLLLRGTLIRVAEATAALSD